MTEEQMNALVDMMQERRMRSHTIYQEALALKAAKQHAKEGERLEKLCEMFAKTVESVDKGLDKLRKYASEMQVIRLSLE
jgi:hypothetical protein